MSDGKIRAPFTPDQVDKLNRFQRLGFIHPFTCPEDHGGADRTLVATCRGWICPHCNYKQDWAHEGMLVIDENSNPLKALKGTPAARWREDGKPDPHGTRYDCPRAELVGGHLTDDEVANAVYLEPSVMNLTVAKDRIRWLSRKMAAAEKAVVLPETMTPAIEEALGMPNFQCGPIARYFREAGHTIKKRSENEQAFILFWALKLAIQHGIAWRTAGGNELDALAKTLEEKAKGAPQLSQDAEKGGTVGTERDA